MLVAERLDGVENVVGQEPEVSLVAPCIIPGLFLARVTFIVSTSEGCEEWSSHSGDNVEEGKEAKANNDCHQEVVVDPSRYAASNRPSLEPGRSAKIVTKANIGVCPTL